MISSKSRFFALLLGGVLVAGLAIQATSSATTRSLTSVESAKLFGAASGCSFPFEGVSVGCNNKLPGENESRCASRYNMLVAGEGNHKLDTLICAYFKEDGITLATCGSVKWAVPCN